METTILTQTLLTGNPLHKSFTYTKTPLADILSAPSHSPFETLLSPPPSRDRSQSSKHTTNSPIAKILVIDCTDPIFTISNAIKSATSLHSASAEAAHKQHAGSDTEMLARALCAERGWNALISRRGRGCLACSIREASALAWRVVLRFA